MRPFTSAAFLRAGSLGTSLAVLLAPKLDDILLITSRPEDADEINRSHRNPRYLKNAALPEHIHAGADHREAAKMPLIFFAVPTIAVRSEALRLASAGLPPDAALVSCSKGIERDSGERMSEILREVFPENPIGILTGPNHAEEIAAGLVTCAVVASENPELAARLQQLFTLPRFRTYTSEDVAGAEFGGAVKNVYAIAAGMAHGLGLGDNAVAALVTRALAEMTRLGVALGGKHETFSGLSGVGDLIVTCFSSHSRNHRVGLALGTGKTLSEAVAALGMVAEGVPNSLSIQEAARRAGVRTPIIDAVCEVLHGGKPAAAAMRDLLNRDPRPEAD